MVAMHANKGCRVVKVDGSDGAGANVGEDYLAWNTCRFVLPKLEIALSAALSGAPALQIMTEAVECT